MQVQVKHLRVKITALTKENLTKKFGDCRPHRFFFFFTPSKELTDRVKCTYCPVELSDSSVYDEENCNIYNSV